MVLYDKNGYKRNIVSQLHDILIEYQPEANIKIPHDIIGSKWYVGDDKHLVVISDLMVNKYSVLDVKLKWDTGEDMESCSYNTFISSNRLVS